MLTPKKVTELYLENTCSSVTIREYDKLYEKATRANKSTINKLVLDHLPDLYEGLALNLWNPYHYYKTKTHLILIHSQIDYFLRWIN